MATRIAYQNDDLIQELVEEINHYLGVPFDKDIRHEPDHISALSSKPSRSSLNSARQSDERRRPASLVHQHGTLLDVDSENLSVPELSPTRSDSMTSDAATDDHAYAHYRPSTRDRRQSYQHHSKRTSVSSFVCSECSSRPPSRSPSHDRLASIAGLVRQTLSASPEAVGLDLDMYDSPDTALCPPSPAHGHRRSRSQTSFHSLDQPRRTPSEDVSRSDRPRSRPASAQPVVDLVGPVLRLRELMDNNKQNDDDSTIYSFTEPITHATLDNETLETPETPELEQPMIEAPDVPSPTEAAMLEHQQVMIPSNLPFLTPSYRTGYAHVALKAHQIRDYATRDDRMNTYNEGYYDCIMAKTSMVDWVRKQYAKGPPDTMFEYTPKPRAAPKKGLFQLKRNKAKNRSTTDKPRQGMFFL